MVDGYPSLMYFQDHRGNSFNSTSDINVSINNNDLAQCKNVDSFSLGVAEIYNVDMQTETRCSHGLDGVPTRLVLKAFNPIFRKFRTINHHHLLNALENKFQIERVYTDFTKAFDKVNYQLLLVKLATWGIISYLLKSIVSLLIRRKQSAKI